MATENKKERGQIRTVQGIVVSDKMEKTIVIEVKTRTQHPHVKKFIRLTRRLKVHDEKQEAGVGDRVLAARTRPLSKGKRHRLIKVLEKAK